MRIQAGWNFRKGHRKLVLNSAEAETVRYIFRRYQELGSVRLLKEHLDATGIVSKHRSARYRDRGCTQADREQIVR
jgi:hypothetical protein